MSSEDVLPTYDEAMKMYQTPWHIIEDEAMNLTFKQHSTASKIKSFISRMESASQHDVYTGPKRKSKIVVFVENMLTARTPKKFHVAELQEAQEDLDNQRAHSRQHQKMPSDDEESFDT
ncbi:hypothetical protein MBLNU13_g00614t1 [Cladosporium sp. NU13]